MKPANDSKCLSATALFIFFLYYIIFYENFKSYSKKPDIIVA